MKLRRLVPVLLLVLAVFVLFEKGVFALESAPAVNPMSSRVYLWYYIPRGEGKQPLPIEKAKYLDKYEVYYVGNPSEKTIYLTFDDCPVNGHIPEILDILAKHRAPAAFFMTEKYIEDNPDVIRRIVGSGHFVCNHTANHVHVTGLSFDRFKSELQGVEDAYKAVTGRELPRYFRPPTGMFSELTLNYTEKLGYKTIFWSFDYLDWIVNDQPSERQAFELIMKETHNGAVVLLHCQSDTNLKILDKVLTAWEERGYTFQNLDHLTKTRVPSGQTGGPKGSPAESPAASQTAG